MAHRSNQAVASQDQTPPPASGEPPPPRRLLIGWATALAALGVSTFLVGLGVWLARVPLAEFMIGAALSERGAEADFQVTSLDLDGVTLRNLRFGAEGSPDASIATVEAHWRWYGLSPRLETVRLTEPRLRLRLDPGGRVSAGALDHISGGAPGRERISIPRINLEIVAGELRIDAPFGQVSGDFRANGRIGEDFAAIARIVETTRAGDNYALTSGAADLAIVSRGDTISVRLATQAQHLLWAGERVDNARVLIMGRAPLDLSGATFEAAWRIGEVTSGIFSATQLTGGVNGELTTLDNALAIESWNGRTHAEAATLAIQDVRMQRPRLTANGEGTGAEARARWSLGGERFHGVGVISNQPAATGRFFIASNGQVSGDALLTLTRSALDSDAQETLRGALPTLTGSPVGPTFARARAALDAAADNFTLTAPLVLNEDEQGLRISMVAPLEARAATGVRLRLSPLRRDAPALVLQWPGPRLSGAVALELAGGGAPTATLLLDTLTSSPDAPFEADGTVSLSDWRADGASIAANELGVTIASTAGGGGRLELRGPALITGPVGDGQVRELAPTLDLAIAWGNGWRVTTSNSACIPVRMGGLDVAGLSFANGAFGLCPLDGVLIAADRARNLSGGFAVQSLALNGRMAGPNGQPARLGAAHVVGRFSGQSDNMTLAILANTPELTIEMAEGRTLDLQLERVTANAHIADSWSVEGGFASGSLDDPTLPGSVSAIEGSWSAAPENGKPVVRVSAAEAVLTANRPASEDERPLFNPLRLVDVDATLREGIVDATGAVLLQAQERQLARFSAQHVMNEGAGAARIVADGIVFGPNLQPYDITERTRGLVDNVTGSTDIIGTIAWTRDTITSTGTARLNNISLAMATIPIIENVNGEVTFDDLFALTTPPGQTLNVGLLNPGVAVTNGRVRFQLLTEQRVAIEHAEFDFASGVLSMEPTTITLGADETRFELSLRDVDATSLLATLNVPDLQATGRLEGSFPLLLTRRSAFVTNGVVRAQGEGGTISYTGQAGQNATGVSRIAFDALRSFRYDALSLTLDGDLNGDVVSSIEFSGQNTGRPVDLGPIAPVPGLGNVQVRGVPFDFNVRVTAPFRRLAQTAATITDPGSLLNQRGNDEDDETVDPDAPAPD